MIGINCLLGEFWKLSALFYNILILFSTDAALKLAESDEDAVPMIPHTCGGIPSPSSNIKEEHAYARRDARICYTAKESPNPVTSHEEPSEEPMCSHPPMEQSLDLRQTVPGSASPWMNRSAPSTQSGTTEYHSNAWLNRSTPIPSLDLPVIFGQKMTSSDDIAARKPQDSTRKQNLSCGHFDGNCIVFLIEIRRFQNWFIQKCCSQLA